jgi:HEAT repeat protein
MLKPEDMKELRPLLLHKDADLVVVGLKVVLAKKEAAAEVAAEVADLLKRDEPRVREAALNALQALGSAADKARPNLTPRLLDHWGLEKDPSVRQALGKVLHSRLAMLKPDDLKQQIPRLLRDKDTDLVAVGLNVVIAKKDAAAVVAGEVADLLKPDNNDKVRGTALAALKAMGPSAKNALPKLLEILKDMPKFQRTALALTIADLVDPKDPATVDPIVPFLLEGLHPKAPQIKVPGESTETAIKQTLVKMGQPAVEGIFTALAENLDIEVSGVDGANYRKNLYYALEQLGPSCRSNKTNFETIKNLRMREIKKKYKDVNDAATAAYIAFDSK